MLSHLLSPSLVQRLIITPQLYKNCTWLHVWSIKLDIEVIYS